MTKITFTDTERERFARVSEETEKGYSPEFLRKHRVMGRPLSVGEEPGVVIQFRLDPQKVESLNAKAKREHRSRSAILRDAVDRELSLT